MKIDLKKAHRHLYQPGSQAFTEIDVPPQTYLSIDGHGDPNTSTDYAAAVSALYATCYAIKFGLRARTDDDFVVGPLEGLWSSSDPAAFTLRNKADWAWTMIIPLPAPMTGDDVTEGLTRTAARKPELPIDRLGVLELTEGRSLQIMHVGPYDAEAATLARLHEEIMPAQGLTWNGRHHEIYLSDPRRIAAEKLKTVLRQPVRPAP